MPTLSFSSRGDPFCIGNVLHGVGNFVCGYLVVVCMEYE